MSIPHLTKELIARVDRFSARFHAARMSALAALPGNPFGVELRFFGAGDGVACKVRHRILRGKNRILAFTAEDLPLLDDLLAFYRRDGLPFLFFVPHGQTTETLFKALTAAGMWSSGESAVPFLVPDGRADDMAPPTSPDILVRLSGLEEKKLYLDLFQQAFQHRDERDPEYRAFQWGEDTLPQSPRYVAEINGVPVGFASFPIVDGVGFFGTGGVLPAYRGRGLQMALIRRRIADAPTLGCNLILAGGMPGTTTYRNFERAGLRLCPTGSAWRAVTKTA